jgi:ferric-dicitrate binding protein FerR (iron transport regulator)/tetratricopeptide (TPR) repeat protein
MSEHEQQDDEILDRNLERLYRAEQQRPEVPPEARARMLGKLRATATPAANDAGGQRRRFGTIGVFVAIAAVAILAWVLGLGERLIGSPDNEQQLASHEHHELGAKAITLADGSRALLRTGTILEELAPRHVRLVAGEVLLDVGEAVEPMLVETPQGRALVLGTRLLLRSDASETLAAVFHGQAKLESTGNATELLLRAGEQALLHGSAAPERIAGRRLSFEIDWARELLAPDQTPEPIRRGNLLARVPRWTGQMRPSPEWPLPVRELIVDVHVEDGHVRTTIDQTFFNHLDRDLEGIYKFPLPPEAAIARLAMYVDGQRMEAGVVERDRGRDIYEQIVHRRRDPALLEWMQGNLFQVRIFPLPGRTEKRILLSYTATLDELYGEGELRVPIPELDLPVGKVKYRIRVVGAAGRELSSRSHEFVLGRDGEDLLAEFEATNHAIGADIVATLTASQSGAVEHHRMVDAAGRRHHGVRVRPNLKAELDALGAAQTLQPARDWVVLFDSSASRGPAELEAQRQFLHELLSALDGGDRLSVALFDSRVRWADAELQSVADIDVAALEQLVARESKVGLGLTDLGLALDEAVARLQSATPPDDDGRERVATLLYLGDGLAQDLGGTADAGLHVDTLAQRFAGRAEFVAVSFGQAYDEPALTRLAAAGTGHYLHVAEGDSVPWRALELLTTLATARVLELEAKFVDAQGQVIAAETTHASALSLSDGETLEVLTRLEPGVPEPVAVELKGRAQLGREGSAWTRRVELPSANDNARWLPRTWARAHVAALTDAGVEENAAAITELGLAHFLVTPTTSLLVLESEAMYRDFAVHRPSEDSWAHYDAPDRIEVIREGDRTEAGRGQYVTRTPIAILNAYSSWGPASGRTRGFAATPNDTIGMGGLGLIGTGRGGGGTGEGFGFGLGPNGLIGKGGGGGAFGGRGYKNRELADASKQAKNKRSSAEFSGFVSRETSRSITWGSSNTQQHAFGQPVGSFAAQDTPFASTIVTGAKKVGGELDGLWPGSQPWPIALHYSSDWRLNDLGELVPALFEEPFDLAREELLITGLDGTRGSISDAAAELIGKARAAQANVRYALPEGGTLDIDASGRFALIHERWGFLDERVVYDGEQLGADYPELGLSVIRAVGPTSPALLGAWVPWMVPEADHLAHFYDVTATGPRTLKLTLIATPETERDQQPWLEVELDAEHRVIALRMHVGERTLSTTSFTWTESGLTLDGDRTLTRVGPAQAVVAEPQATRVSFPLPSPDDLELELSKHAAGTPAWIEIQQQRLAGSAALGQLDDVRTVLEQLAQQGRVLPGELVLGGAALYHAAPSVRDAVLDAAAEGPIRDYVRAGWQASDGRIVALRKLADQTELAGTPVGFWANYRAILFEAERNPGEPSLRRLERFLTAYSHPSFAYVATLQLSNRWWHHYDRKATAWLALAEQDNQWKYFALHQAGLAQYYRGHYDDAAKLFSRAMDEAERDQTLPVVDWNVQWAYTNSFGEASWQLVWSRLRERVSKSDDPRLALRFIVAAQQLGRPEDVQRVLDRLEPEHMDPEVGVMVFDMLVNQGHVSEARAVLDNLQARAGDSTDVLLRASALAEQQGELDEAAQTLERALVLILDERGMSLDELRSGFAHLFELRARQARPLASTEQTAEAALQAALAVADRWRHEDPDNPVIDQLCAELLWSLERDDEAWRHLSSVLDRHAAEGEALAWLADALERSGRLDRAETVWARAVAVEPTEVHNRVRRATNLIANGREAEAQAALQEIIDGEWQPRFAWDVEQARRLLRKLDEQTE